MVKLILQRLLQMALIMLVVSLVLFVVFDSPKFKKQLAVNELGGFAVATLTQADYEKWLENKGLNVPIYERYGKWVWGLAHGDFGRSFQKNADVGFLLGHALIKTGILAFWVFALMIPLALVTGVLAGIKEGRAQDRVITFLSVLFTSIPEIATAIILTVVFALGLHWLPAKSKGDGLEYIVLPVLDARSLRFWLRGANDARLRRRGDDLAIHSHGRVEGNSVPPRDHATRLAERADRALHGDHPAAQLAALRCRRRGGLLPVQRLRKAPA